MEMLKKQGVAWIITAVMIVAAIAIGFAKAPGSNSPSVETPRRTPPVNETVPPGYDPAAAMYICDDAGVLSASTENELADRNSRLLDRYDVAIGVITCDRNYGRNDLDNYALKRADDMGQDAYDFIVALDIRSGKYMVIQGVGLVNDFTDDDCIDYADKYMGPYFAVGDYDSAVLKLAAALEDWYNDFYR